MHRQNGFTLVEVLVAMVILSVGVVAWVMSQSNNIRNRSRSEIISQAAILGQSQLEELTNQALSWGSDHADVNGTEVVNLGGQDYNVLWAVVGGDIFSKGTATWKIVTTVNWGKWGNGTISCEKVVTGR